MIKIENCEYHISDNHTELRKYNFECPLCKYVAENNRSGLKRIGKNNWLIKFSWLDYRRTREKDMHDPYDRDSCGEYDEKNGFALLNKNFQLITKSTNKSELLTLVGEIND